MVTVQYNPFIPEVHANPYPMYARLRADDPIHWSPLMEAWVLTRYDDVVAVLTDSRFSADRRRARHRCAPGAHPPAQAGEQGVHAAHGGRAPAAHPGDRGRTPGRRGAERPHGR